MSWMPKALRDRHEDERGAVLVITAFFLVICIGMGAVVVDLAQLREDRARDRKTADVISSAAATRLAAPDGTMSLACTDAWNYFLDNTADHGTVATAPPTNAPSVNTASCVRTEARVRSSRRMRTSGTRTTLSRA